MNHAVDADTASLRRRGRIACVVAALAAGTLIAAVPHRARAQDSASEDRCAAALQNAPQPPAKATPVLLRVLQPSIEPVPATDGLIHLAYVTQVMNALTRPADILEVVAVDPTADFVPTGHNIELDPEGQDVAGKVMRDVSMSFAPDFVTRLPAESWGLMLFDVTYADQAQIPRLLAHAITVANYPAGTPGVPALTDPVPVGCVPLGVIHPPWSGMAGWR